MCGPSETDPFVVNGRPSALYPKLGVHLTEMDMEMKYDRCAHLNRSFNWKAPSKIDVKATPRVLFSNGLVLECDGRRVWASVSTEKWQFPAHVVVFSPCPPKKKGHPLYVRFGKAAWTRVYKKTSVGLPTFIILHTSDPCILQKGQQFLLWEGSALYQKCQYSRKYYTLSIKINTTGSHVLCCLEILPHYRLIYETCIKGPAWSISLLYEK